MAAFSKRRRGAGGGVIGDNLDGINEYYELSGFTEQETTGTSGGKLTRKCSLTQKFYSTLLCFQQL
jgi:hypothetical protein